MLDGYGWQPLFDTIDMPALVDRIGREVFAAEFAQLAHRN